MLRHKFDVNFTSGAGTVLTVTVLVFDVYQCFHNPLVIILKVF